MEPAAGIHSHAWQKTRARILATATHCAICGKPLNPAAPPRSRWSTAVDHIAKREHGGALLDPRNLRAVHTLCNTLREHDHRRAQRKPPRRSREW